MDGRDVALIPRTRIVPNPWNRKAMPKGLKELSASIKAEGLISPLVVRPKGEQYEIVAGERRWRAAELAGMEQVPCFVRLDLTDQQARQLCLAENIMREDLHPLDEARMLAELVADGAQLKELSARFGRSVAHLQRRLTLTKLAKPWRKAMEQENPLSVAAAEELARWPEHIQQDAYGQFRAEDGTPPSANALRQWMTTTYSRELKQVAWDVTDATLDPEAGPCSTCPKQSGALVTLFAEFKDEARCLDSVCWRRKLNRHLTKLLAVEGTVPISDSYYCEDATWKKVCVYPDKYVVARKKCDDRERGIYVNGHAIGKEVPICRNRKCPTHMSPEIRQGKAQGDRDKQLTKFTKKMREEFSVQASEAAKAVGARPPIEVLRFALTRSVDRLHYDMRKALGELLGLRKDEEKASEFCEHLSDRLDKHLEKLESVTEINRVWFLSALVQDVPHAHDADSETTHYYHRDPIKELKELGKVLEVELIPATFAEAKKWWKQYRETKPAKDDELVVDDEEVEDDE